MRTRLVGIDCATQDTKIGLAYGDFSDGHLAVTEADTCTKRVAADAIASWLRRQSESALLAIDAPLGWPQSLARELAKHRAGRELKAEPNQMFRRATDRFVKQKTRKTPLDVGANRIARAAHAALALLKELRRKLDDQIPLAWEWPLASKISVIEVYPAATLSAHGLPSTRYSGPSYEVRRNELVQRLSGIAYIPFDVSRKLVARGDVLDAAVCLLAARDFLSGEAMPPPDRDFAEIEGWIWVRQLEQSSLEGEKAAESVRKQPSPRAII